MILPTKQVNCNLTVKVTMFRSQIISTVQPIHLCATIWLNKQSKQSQQSQHLEMLETKNKKVTFDKEFVLGELELFPLLIFSLWCDRLTALISVSS